MEYAIKWDEAGEKIYENGCDRGVLYPLNASTNKYDNGVEWNGLREVNETPEGAEPSKFYADNIQYATLMSVEEYKASIGAYTYPDEFEACDGSASIATGIYIGQQQRQKFGFCYRTRVGNDLTEDLGYKIHVVYNCVASPSDRNHETVNDSPALDELSWDVTATPVNVTGHKPTASLVIDSRKISAENLAILEQTLYGFVADAFDSTKTYTVGDFVSKGGKTYKYLGAASFDPTDWEEVVAPEFSTESTYAVGDYVTYSDKIYVCSVAVETAGEWDATNWTEVQAAAFSATTSYAVGDYCTYETKTYKCTTAIVIEGGWNPNEWVEVNASPQLPLPDEIAALVTEG